jgi:uncharacterized protein (TIGR03118 family)
MKMISFSFHSARMGRSLATALFVAGLQMLLVTFPSGNLRAWDENEEGHFFRWVNLQSDIPGVADRTDPNLVNPWGLAVGPTGIFWVADNHTGFSTLYAPNGKPIPLLVKIPASSGIATDVASPTGLVFNNPNDGAFLLSNHQPALFIFDAEDGGISAWNLGLNPVTEAVLVRKNSAIYKGLALGNRPAPKGGPTLYAADFHNRKVDVFDSEFGPVVTNGFKPLGTPPIPHDFAPFGIANIDGFIYVTYAEQKPPDNADDLSGEGHGFINVYLTDGTFVRRLVSNVDTNGKPSALNSPWGLAKVPPGGFGELGPNVLLVGNFGDGKINAFDIYSGEFLGSLLHRQNQPLQFSGLWALLFFHHRLYFTAGLAEEEHGLFGFVRAVENEDHHE